MQRAGDYWKEALKGLGIDNIIFLDLGTGYTDAFSLFRFVNYICMICALFCLNVAPKKFSKWKKKYFQGF